MRGGSDNRVARWAVYNLAWIIIRRRYRQVRPKLIAAGVIGLVLAAGIALSRSRSD